MKAYIATTGIAFALIVVAHVARIFAEGVSVLREPVFLLTSVLSIAICVWAAALLTRASPAKS